MELEPYELSVAPCNQTAATAKGREGTWPSLRPEATPLGGLPTSQCT